MTKAELIAVVGEKAGLTKKDADMPSDEEVVDVAFGDK